MSNNLEIRKAAEHNLHDIDINLPRDSFVVITGVSGSGKSSLAFDTIFEEGQRRYIESLSPYARQFIGTMKRPDAESIRGISPTISIDQKTINRNPRSTVGTVVEIFDHYRLLFARLGVPHCPKCGEEIKAQTAEQIADLIFEDKAGQNAVLMAPIIRERKGEYRKEIAKLQEKGFARVRVDGVVYELNGKAENEIPELARYEKHSIDAVIDRITIEAKNRTRFMEGLEQAFKINEDRLVSFLFDEKYVVYSANLACAKCGISLPEIEPRLFSFNDKNGQCPTCKGLGKSYQIEISKLINPELSIEGGAILASTSEGRLIFSNHGIGEYKSIARRLKFSLATAWKDLPKKSQDAILYGDGVASGIVPILQGLWDQWHISLLQKYMLIEVCEECSGERICAAARAMKFNGKGIAEISAMSIDKSVEFFNNIKLSEKEERIGREIFREIRGRLKFMQEVGLGYLTLNRGSATLSGGEAQRIRLAGHVGAGLQGVLYVLDEPSIGLHARDNEKLLDILEKLRAQGNSLIVVEHDEETMLRADCVVDIGPGAGSEGGHLVGMGSVDDLCKNENSLTGAYLSGKKRIEIPLERVPVNKDTAKIRIVGARANNLKNIDVEIPVGKRWIASPAARNDGAAARNDGAAARNDGAAIRNDGVAARNDGAAVRKNGMADESCYGTGCVGVFTVVTGVSGSGKSTLINHILRKALAKKFYNASEIAGEHDRIEGLENIDKVIEIDQSPIGRTPRSNPATYTKIFDEIRNLFASVPDSKIKGYSKSRFSFNVAGGRCEKCGGSGVQEIEMQILPNVQITCDECGGKRFNDATLTVFFKNKNIADVLDLSISDALEFFIDLPKISRPLGVLKEIGLGYVKLGQPSTTLSGGEAQRMKISTELRRLGTGKTLYLLDEPTTGLHFEDIRKLLECLQKLKQQGNSLVVIEHNLDVIKCADWVIDLGPEAGEKGGYLVVQGTPEQVAKCKKSHTGKFLIGALGTHRVHLLNSALQSHSGRPMVAPTMPVCSARRADGGNVVSLSTSQDLNIRINGARKHNLKNISVSIPRHKITCITGVSGAGKSSLAFDTLFAEGQRRFLESLSTYARRFLGKIDRGSVDSIHGLAPAIAIDQQSASKSPRSTVATLTEIYDYFRIMWARLGIAHCKEHTSQKLEKYSPSELLTYLLSNNSGELVQIYSGKHILDRVVLAEKNKTRLLDDFEKAYQENNGELGIKIGDGKFIKSYFNYYACPKCGWSFEYGGEKGGGRLSNTENVLRTRGELNSVSVPPASPEGEKGGGRLSNTENVLRTRGGDLKLDPKNFSFNSHFGACEKCQGLGEIDSHLRGNSTNAVCPECNGNRLKKEFLAVKIGGCSITDATKFSISESAEWFKNLSFTETEKIIAEPLLKEILGRLEFLTEVGIPYINLDRSGDSLSGGEAQRLRLAGQIGSGLEGVLYVLDEPTIGLHQSDTKKLLNSLYRLRDLGNTIVVVEHDLEFIKAGDYIIDLGAKAGEFGGEVVAEGTPRDLSNAKAIKKFPQSATVPYLSGKRKLNDLIEKDKIRTAKDTYFSLSNLTKNNLKNISVKIPFGAITAVSGVSGSGKSSLMECIYEIAQKKKQPICFIDQTPINLSPRSTPVSYMGILDHLRDLFAKIPEAKIRGYDKGRFAYNVERGRCEVCEGRGYKLIEMHFLSDVWELCEACKGKRYNSETLTILWKGKSIADILDMQIEKAAEFFKDIKKLKMPLQTLSSIGLGYLRLGQATTTMSGGEIQRLKLAAELCKNNSDNTIYLLDEPTTGLHLQDIQPLWEHLRELSNAGNAVVFVEHHPDMIRLADNVIELGPAGGNAGGYLL